MLRDDRRELKIPACWVTDPDLTDNTENVILIIDTSLNF